MQQLGAQSQATVVKRIVAQMSVEQDLRSSDCCTALQGVKDDVVDISAGRALHAAALNPVEPLWAQNCDHQNVEMDPNYVTRLKEFVRQIFK